MCDDADVLRRCLAKASTQDAQVVMNLVNSIDANEGRPAVPPESWGFPPAQPAQDELQHSPTIQNIMQKKINLE